MRSGSYRIFIGFDKREAAAYHTCVQSIIETCPAPWLLQFTPVSSEARDGSNAFIYARFLVPWLCGFEGPAVFLDGDMIVRADIRELFACDMSCIGDISWFGVRVVKHDYRTKFPVKYLGNKNEDYPRKNWSSVILWNCAHPAHLVLTPERVLAESGAYLHRFAWLRDEDIGELPPEWNRLMLEQEPSVDDKLRHHTIGIPPFGYPDAEWDAVHKRANTPC